MMSRKQRTDLWLPELWLPRTPPSMSSMRERLSGRRHFPGYPCGCDKGCDCECDLSLDGTVKCCMDVTIALMAGSGGDCTEAECLEYNKTYSLYRSTGDDSGNCIWKCEYLGQDCDADTITATLYLDGTDYKLKVELGLHVWEKNFGETKPDLCKGGPWELDHISDGGSCDSSSATCSVAMADGEGSCGCQSPLRFSVCSGPTPAVIIVTLAGVANGTHCNNCAQWNGTFACEQTSFNYCCWAYNPTPDVVCGLGFIQVCIWETYVKVRCCMVQYNDTRYCAQYGVFVKALTAPVDCLEDLDGNVPLDDPGDGSHCDFSNATCEILV